MSRSSDSIHWKPAGSESSRAGLSKDAPGPVDSRCTGIDHDIVNLHTVKRYVGHVADDDLGPASGGLFEDPPLVCRKTAIGEPDFDLETGTGVAARSGVAHEDRQAADA